MYMGLNIKFWGVRGSLPAAPTPKELSLHFEGLLRQFFNSGKRDISEITQFIQSLDLTQIAGFGSATSCVEVQSAKSSLIIDGGSGIRSISENILRGRQGSIKGPFHIYLTHYHWDHVLGLPFFAPHFIPNTPIHYYAVHADVEKYIRAVFAKPYFPVPFENLASKIQFHIVEPRKPFTIEDMICTPYKLDHPDPCWGLKIESGGKAYAHCVDTEGTRITREEMGPDLPLYQNVDLMYFDAQYTLPELAEKSNWGHSASQVGLDIAFRENIKNVLFTHHDPGHSIQDILDLKKQTGEYYQWRIQHAKDIGEKVNEIFWDFAIEGQEIKL